MSAATDRELRAQRGRVWGERVDHVRIGAWRGAWSGGVHLVGLARELHGTVCTCCPRKMTGG